MHTPTHSTDAPFPRPPCSTSQQGSGGARTLTHSPTRDRRTPAAHEAHAHGTKCMRDLGQTVRALAARMQTWQWHMPAALHPYDVTRHILFNRAMCSVSHHMRDGGGRALLVAHGPSLRPASSRSIRVSKHERSVLILLDGYEETLWAPANQCCGGLRCRPCACQVNASRLPPAAHYVRTASSGRCFTSCCEQHGREHLSLARAASPQAAGDGRRRAIFSASLEIGVFR